MGNRTIMSLSRRGRIHMGLAVVAVLVGVLFYSLPQPLDEVSYRGGMMKVYSISALIFRFVGQFLWITAGYFVLQLFSDSWPLHFARDKMLYKLIFLFLLLMIMLALMEFFLRGMFTEDILNMR